MDVKQREAELISGTVCARSTGLVILTALLRWRLKTEGLGNLLREMQGAEGSAFNARG